MESKHSTTAIEQTFRTLNITNTSPSTSPSTSFPLFPLLPLEIRLQIWAHAILSLPGRIIPLKILSKIIAGKKRTPAYFVSRHPHPLISTVNSEAKTAVIETLGPLFLPGNNHTFITANLEKDIFMLSPVFYPKTIKRLLKAIGEDRGRQLKNLAIEIEVQREIPRSRWDPISFEGGCSHRDLMQIYETFPNLDTLSLVPHNCGSAGSAEYRGELKFVEGNEWEEWSSGSLRQYVRWAEPSYKKEWRIHADKEGRDAKYAYLPSGPEAQLRHLGVVGGKVRRCWDPVTRVLYWGIEDLNTVEAPRPYEKEEGKMYLGPVRRIRLPESMDVYINHCRDIES
jgi:hypothetical protein